MDLSVVVPTLNNREELRRCLDALAEHTPELELIVVNGPSSDGTTGMVRDRPDVDVLVEVSERNGNVARNAGIETATGDYIAFVDSTYAIEPSWYDAVRTAFGTGADVVTGPTHRSLRAGVTTETETTETVAGRTVTFFNGDNVAFRVETLQALDGFDEYLAADGERDTSHRLAGLDYSVTWDGEMSVRGEYEADGGRLDREIGSSYRARAYRLVKNYGIRPRTAAGTLWRALRDSIDAAGDVTRGDLQPTVWLRSGRDVIGGLIAGVYAGLRARRADRSYRRNPNGVSTRHDRAVQRYDRR